MTWLMGKESFINWMALFLRDSGNRIVWFVKNNEQTIFLC